VDLIHALLRRGAQPAPHRLLEKPYLHVKDFVFDRIIAIFDAPTICL